MIYLGNKPVGFADRHFLSASGTFTGDGTSAKTLAIGVKPDILMIWADVDYSESGWSGVGQVVVRRGAMLAVNRHNGTTATTATNNYYWLTSTSGDFGNASEAPSNTFYGTYSDGTLALTNKTSAEGTRFSSRRTYRWAAFGLGGE